MIKNKRVFILISILAQSMLAMIAGFFVLNFASENRISPGTTVEGVDIGGMNKASAVKKLEEHYLPLIENGKVNIFLAPDNSYEIKYQDLDVTVDCESTIASVSSIRRGGWLLNLIGMYFYPSKRTVAPVVKLSEWKLRKKLEELALLTDKEPRDARVYLEGDKVVKEADVDGQRLNIDNLLKRIMDEFRKTSSVSVSLKPGESSEIETVKATITLNSLEGIDEVISQYKTPIVPGIDADSVKRASDVIDRVMLRAGDEGRNIQPDEFSFNTWLAREGKLEEKNNEGYNLIVSTLYAAVLAAGIDPGGISRVPHETTAGYIEPGLDARVLGDSIDFKFVNSLKQNIIIFSEVRDGMLTVSIAGRKEDPSVRYELKTDTLQKFTPSVLNVENSELKAGEKILIDPGREGVKVNVYRFTVKNGEKIKEELISTDTYEAVKSVVQIGPGTEWKSGVDK